MQRFGENRTLVYILLLGLCLRLLWLFFVPGNFLASSDDYDLIAQNIISGNGYKIFPTKPTGERMPLYPLFLVTIYKIFGRDIVLVCTLQAFIDMITCLMIFKTALMIFKSRKVAHITALFYAIYVPYYSLIGVIMNEILFNLSFSIFIYFYLKHYKTLNLKNSFFLGLMLGISTMIRETPFILIALLILTPVFTGQTLKKCVKLSLMIILGFSILYSPWFIRNAIVFKSFVVLSTHAGFNLYTNYYEPEVIEGLPSVVLDLETQNKMMSESEVVKDMELLKRAFRVMKENPGHVVEVIAANFFEFWFNLSFINDKRCIRYYAVGGEMFSFSYTILFFNGLILFFALLGIYKKLRSKWEIEYTLILVVIGFFNILHMIFICYVRHSMPIIAYMMMFASFYLVSISKRYLK